MSGTGQKVYCGGGLVFIFGPKLKNKTLLRPRPKLNNMSLTIPGHFLKLSPEISLFQKSEKWPYLEFHQMLFVLNSLAGNQKYVSESFDNFKEEVTSSLKNIKEDTIIMKQELFILRQQSQTKQPQQAPPTAPSKPTAGEATKDTPKVHAPAAPKENNHTKEPNDDVSHIKQRKVLLIGDSIASNIDKEVIERGLKAKVRTSKAYGSIFDNVGSKVKAAARFPAKNFRDVTPIELKKEQVDYLILQAGSVDITNLDTKNKPDENIDYFKQEVRFSAKNLFATAEAALDTQPSLQKVVIMNLTPRYQMISDDPLSLKPALVLLFNNTLTELWLDSPYKQKIVIGKHNLDCTGGIREARYRDIKNQKFDAVHLFGPSGQKAYTISVLDILKSADILDQTDAQIQSGQEFFRKNCNFEYQKKNRSKNNNQRRNHGTARIPDSDNVRDIRPKRNHRGKDTPAQRYTVPTSNIFDHLNY